MRAQLESGASLQFQGLEVDWQTVERQPAVARSSDGSLRLRAVSSASHAGDPYTPLTKSPIETLRAFATLARLSIETFSSPRSTLPT
jgi:hypothetical protein